MTIVPPGTKLPCGVCIELPVADVGSRVVVDAGGVGNANVAISFASATATATWQASGTTDSVGRLQIISTNQAAIGDEVTVVARLLFNGGPQCVTHYTVGGASNY